MRDRSALTSRFAHPNFRRSHLQENLLIKDVTLAERCLKRIRRRT